MSYDAVIFDNDGVLVTLVEGAILRQAAHDAFAAFDIDPTEADVEALKVGVTPTILDDLCDRYDLDPAEFWRVRDRTVSLAQQVEIRAARKALYDDFDVVRRLDVPLGIVSSNQQATVDFVLDHYGIDHLFETAYGREPTPLSLERKKPNPYYLRQAMADLEAETALFVGDSESDVVAADRAAIDSAFVRRAHRDDYALSATPTYEIGSLTPLPELVE